MTCNFTFTFTFTEFEMERHMLMSQLSSVSVGYSVKDREIVVRFPKKAKDLQSIQIDSVVQSDSYPKDTGMLSSAIQRRKSEDDSVFMEMCSIKQKNSKSCTDTLLTFIC